LSAPVEQPKKFRAIVYVDGFNLYYGCLKGSPYKWLNLSLLASKLLNENYEVVKICYFTSEVVDYKNDGVTTRQGFYLSALRTIPNLEVYFGKFKERDKTVYINPPEKILFDTGFGEKVVPKSIFKGKCFEEKGTDVNLATSLLIDLYEDKFDTALILSNDTDYKSAVHQVRKKGKKIFVVNTKVGFEPDVELRIVSTKSTRKISKDMLRDSQFPEMVGNIRKPKDWE
jgi:uncharacterized LabA/DUF88 family protein